MKSMTLRIAFVLFVGASAGFGQTSPKAKSTAANAVATETMILRAINAAFDAAEALDEKCFDPFSSMADVRFATEGTAPALAEFKREWQEAVKQVSRPNKDSDGMMVRPVVFVH